MTSKNNCVHRRVAKHVLHCADLGHSVLSQHILADSHDFEWLRRWTATLFVEGWHNTWSHMHYWNLSTTELHNTDLKDTNHFLMASIPMSSELMTIATKRLDYKTYINALTMHWEIQKPIFNNNRHICRTKIVENKIISNFDGLWNSLMMIPCRPDIHTDITWLIT